MTVNPTDSIRIAFAFLLRRVGYGMSDRAEREIRDAFPPTVAKRSDRIMSYARTAWAFRLLPPAMACVMVGNWIDVDGAGREMADEIQG